MKRSVGTLQRVLSCAMMRDALGSCAVRMGGLILSAAQAMITARLLGVVDYGAVWVAISAAQVAATVAVFGLGALAVRELARLRTLEAEEKTSRFIRGSTLLVLTTSAGAASLMAGFGLLCGGAIGSFISLGALSIVPLALLMLGRGFAQGASRILASQLPADILRPLLLIVGIGMLSQFAPARAAEEFLLLFAGTAIIAASVSLYPLLTRVAERSAGPTGEWRGWLRQAAPFAGLTLMTGTFVELHVLLLGWLAGAEAVGTFQPVVRLGLMMALAMEVANLGFAPRIAALHAIGRDEEIARLTRTFTFATLTLTVVLALGMSLGGKWLLSLFGPGFVAGAPFMWVIAAAQVSKAACGPQMTLASMRGEAERATGAQAISLVLSLALGAVLIPLLGVGGAVAALCLAILGPSLLLLLPRPRRREPLAKSA